MVVLLFQGMLEEEHSCEIGAGDLPRSDPTAGDACYCMLLLPCLHLLMPCNVKCWVVLHSWDSWCFRGVVCRQVEVTSSPAGS